MPVGSQGSFERQTASLREVVRNWRALPLAALASVTLVLAWAAQASAAMKASLLSDPSFVSPEAPLTNCGPLPLSVGKWQPYSQTAEHAPVTVSRPNHGSSSASLLVEGPALGGCSAYGAFQDVAANALPANTSFTFSAWIYPVEGSQIQSVLYPWESRDNGGPSFYIDEKLIAGTIEIAAWGKTTTLTKSLTLNTWHEVKLSVNATGKTATLFVDGTSVGKTPKGTAYAATEHATAWVGQPSGTGASASKFYYDEVSLSLAKPSTEEETKRKEEEAKRKAEEKKRREEAEKGKRQLVFDPDFTGLAEPLTDCGPTSPSEGQWQPYSQTAGYAPTTATSPTHGSSATSLRVEGPALGGCSAYGAYQDFGNHALPAESSFALSLWIYPVEGTQIASVLYPWNERVNGGRAFWVEENLTAGTVEVEAWGKTATFSKPLAPSTWHEVKLSVNGKAKTSSLSVDGTLVGETPKGTAYAATEDATIWVGQPSGVGAAASKFYYDEVLVTL